MKRFETSQWVPFPVDLVFSFFANSSNLLHLVPDDLETRILEVRLQAPPQRPPASPLLRHFPSEVAGEGSIIQISFKPLGWMPKVAWTARITEFVWNSHFCDEQVKGPFKYFHHRHGMQEQARDGVRGTLVTDTIDFDQPYGILGLIAAPIAQRQLSRRFAFRQKALPESLQVAARLAEHLAL
ncbi:MAG: SRPBCC family protein [Terracidiphilus sp.]|jgi:ligand-binding SRPBCC domain-containing protein